MHMLCNLAVFILDYEKIKFEKNPLLRKKLEQTDEKPLRKNNLGNKITFSKIATFSFV